ncbi:MAG: sugar phosphate nucleotidyltransferase [bacterium]
MSRKIIVLAGGISSRMKKSSSEISSLDSSLIKDANEKTKAMIGLGDGKRPFLDYLLYEIKKAEYDEVIIVIGEKDFSIKNYYGEKLKNNNFYGLNISYAIQYIPKERIKPLGTADAVYQALIQFPEFKKSVFAIVNSDNLYSAKALKTLYEDSCENVMLDYDRDSLLFPKERIERFAVTVKKNDYLVDIIEKPTSKQIEFAKDKNEKIGVSMNAWKNHYDALMPYLETVQKHPERDEKELPTAEINMVYNTNLRIFTRDFIERKISFLRKFNNFLIQEKNLKTIKCIFWKEHVPDLTSKEDILPAQNYIKENFSVPQWK